MVQHYHPEDSFENESLGSKETFPFLLCMIVKFSSVFLVLFCFFVCVWVFFPVSPFLVIVQETL